MRFPVTLTLSLILAGAAGLSGCHRSSPGRVALPPPLAAALKGPGAVNAGGEAPLWALQIRPKTLSFSSERVSAIDLVNPGPASIANGGVWSGTAGGRPFRAEILAQPCRDAATGLTYPLTARVQAIGYTYQGCAARAGQGLGPRT